MNISISLDEDLLLWIDELIENGVLKSRSEAVREGIQSYLQGKLGISSRGQLREFITRKQKKKFQDPIQAIKSIREEE